MKTLLSKKQKHLLWRAESIKDDFLLLKYAEVYRYSKNVLRVYLFNKKMLPQLKEMGLILNEIPIDDKFYMFEAKVEKLPQLIAPGAFRRRPQINGKWIKSREQILGHKILPYRYNFKHEK